MRSVLLSFAITTLAALAFAALAPRGGFAASAEPGRSVRGTTNVSLHAAVF
jgi:hypothetical protein